MTNCSVPQLSEQELKNSALYRLDDKYMSWGDTVHYQSRPIIADSCLGDRVVDIHGNIYLDSQMWHSSCNFGYRNREIEQAVERQLHKLPQVSGDYLHEEKLLLAEEICEAIYQRTGLRGRVGFNVGGMLVVEDALKIVRKNTGRNRVATLMGGYHGRSLTVSGMSSSHRYRQYYGEFADRAIMFPYANCGQCYYDKQPGECGSYCGKMISRAMENDFYGIASENSNEIGAFFFELCQGRGYTAPPKDFFRQFVPEMQKRGILIVDDEIQVGMFRTGKLFAFEHYDIVPDIITLGKSLTNGLSPLSAVWAREELVSRDIFTPGHAHSNFANHSLGTAAALQTWRYMIAQDYEPLLSQKSAYFMGGLRRLKQRYPFIGLIEGLGMLFSVTFTTPDGLPWCNAGKQAVTLAQDNDYVYQGETLCLILNSGGYHCEKIKLAPWLDMGYEEMERMLTILDQVFAALADAEEV